MLTHSRCHQCIWRTAGSNHAGKGKIDSDRGYELKSINSAFVPGNFSDTNMPSLEITGILVLGALTWLWLDSLKVRELAIRAARAACASDDLMLLDDTVAISALKPARNEEGRVKLLRAYVFEFSDNGNNRLNGSVIMLGHELALLNIGSRIAPAIKMGTEFREWTPRWSSA
jgi:hypothetical protein